MSPIFLKREPRYDLRHKAFPYQEEALSAIRDLEYAAVFHEQGLGKTKIAVDLMMYWFEKGIVDTVLLFAKKTLVNNWLKEFKIHTHITPKVLTQNRKSNFFVFNSPARVILANYEVITSEQERIELFLRTRNVAAILDESTKIKNPTSSLAKSFHDIAPLFKRRILLTGTPVANRPYDIWSQVWFLDLGRSLGNDFPSFKRELDLSNRLYADQNAQSAFEIQLEDVAARISSFSVRETKSSNIIKLPQKIIEAVKTDWEPHQYELYQQIRMEERAIILRDGVPSEDRSDDILKRLLRLLQVGSNPALIDQSYSAEPGKFSFLFDLIRRIAAQKEKCIVWTSFTSNADWLKNELYEFGCVKVHGKLSIDIRNSTIDKFMIDPECKILVATPGAAKEGLTLTVANHVIFYDRSFSLDDYLQAQDRIHRISQKKTCYVYNLIMKDSIDEWVDILLHSKKLAAQLAQGDISHEYYRSQISYDFGHVIKQILGAQEEQG
jgi:SNF2 family DNA or RNA helicase